MRRDPKTHKQEAGSVTAEAEMEGPQLPAREHPELQGRLSPAGFRANSLTSNVVPPDL